MMQKKEWKNRAQKEKITLVCSIVFFVVMACLFAYSFIETSPGYIIEKKACLGPFKCSYDLRIETKLSKEELTLIANKIKRISPQVDRIFILYYLPCMVIGNGAWATSHFDPGLRVEINEFMLMGNPVCLDNSAKAK